MPRNLSASVLSLPNEVATANILSFHNVDPGVGAGVAASVGSLALRTDDGSIYMKTAIGDTGWTAIGNVAGLVALAFSGSASDLVGGTLPVVRMPAMLGDVTHPEGSVTTAIGDDTVSNTMLRNSQPTSVIGRSPDSTGSSADILAPADGQIFARSNGVLRFLSPGTVDVYLGEIATPPRLNAGAPTFQTHNWNPFGSVADATVVRARSAATGTSGIGAQQITGMQGGFPGRRVLILNIGVVDSLIFEERNALSLEANQFLERATCGPGEGRVFWYDGATSKWIQTGAG